MLNDKQNFITSIVSKIKGDNGIARNPFVRSIGMVKYKYMLFKAKDDGCYHRGYTDGFDYINGSKLSTFHVVNDEIGELLYEVLSNNQIDSQSFPEEFKGISFVALNKLKKVVYITFDTEKNSYLRSIRNDDKKKLLQNIYNLLSWFSVNFSLEDRKICINYEAFFDSFLSCGSFLVSFFDAIYVSHNDTYKLTYLKLENIINMLLSFCGSSKLDIEKLKHNIERQSDPFYYFIHQGIYIKDMDEIGFFNLPNNLLINIFKYVLDNRCFVNLEDFFKKIETQNELVENLIFDKKLFEEELNSIEENEDFIIYKKELNVIGLHHESIFMKIKDNISIPEVEETINLLISEDLIHNVSLMYSYTDNQYFLCNYKNNTKVIKLHKYIMQIGNKQEKLTELLLLVNDLFSSKASVRQKAFFKSNANYMELLCIDNETKKLNFGDITTLSFNKKEGYTPFQYPLCIMQIIKRFLLYNDIEVDEIYKCSFIKLFPQAFTKELIHYINTKEYKAKGIIGKLKDILSAGDDSKIEFLENISLSNQKLLQRISFVPEALENDLVQEIEKAKVKSKSNKGADYISVDESINFVTNNTDLCLSKKLLEKLTYCLTDVFFIPEKVIISKDIYDEKNYKIIGVIWNKSNLYRLSDLIESKDINTQNIYQTIICKLMRMYDTGCFADRLNTGIGSLLLDDNYNVLFDCNSYITQKDVCRDANKSLNVYYRDIMRLITTELGQKLNNFTYFNFDELQLNNHVDTSYEEIFNKLKFCDEHKRLYLSGVMCEECEKIYSIATSDNHALSYMPYRIDNTDFYEVNMVNELGNGIYKTQKDIVWIPNSTCRKNIRDSVKIGIEKGLYNSFVALRPQKIVLTNKSRAFLGVRCSNYDFSGKIELDSFKHLQRLKVILILYKKILPLINDYSFIASSDKVFSTMFMDKNYKGEIIIPNLSLLKCEVSVSEDMDLKEREKEETLKLFSGFLFQYIISDETLRVEMKNKAKFISEIIQSIRRCDFTDLYIKAYLASKDSYCKVHKTYFSSSDKICPECIAAGITSQNAIVFDNQYFEKLKSEQQEYEGGEANLYFSEEGQIDKIFNKDVNLSFKSKVIGKALQKAKLFQEFNDTHDDVKFVQIDKVLYSYDNGTLNLEGYRQNFIPDSFKISSLKEKSFVEQLGYERKDVVEILMKVCIGIEYLHSIGGFIGDLNGGNILIKDKVVYIIDMDGMSYDDVKNCVYTDMYIYPPSAENKNITALDDWYSLAVQAFYYLTYSHPFRGICENSAVPVNEVERMKYGFSVLGKHGIKKPNISIGWDMMPKHMIDFFLETFEGTRRENMLETLQSYLNYMEKNEVNFERVVRQHQIKRALTENIYVDTDGNLYYKEQRKLRLEIPEHKYNESIMGCGYNILITSQYVTVVINDKTGEIFWFNKMYNTNNNEIMYVDNNRIYYTEGNNTVYVDTLDVATQQITTSRFSRKSTNRVWSMRGYRDSGNFVLLEENYYANTYNIYYNMCEVCSLSQDEFSDQEEATIIYDEISGKWLVLISCSGKLKGIVINKSGTYSEFTLDIEKIPESLSFYKNTLYFTGQGKICMYNINSQELKSISCSVATSKSAIERVDNKFIIVNEKTTYRYVKS